MVILTYLKMFASFIEFVQAIPSIFITLAMILRVLLCVAFKGAQYEGAPYKSTYFLISVINV